MGRCANCGTANPPGRAFSMECGAVLGLVCAECGPNDPGSKFCGQCGARLPVGPSSEAAKSSAEAPRVSGRPAGTGRCFPDEELSAGRRAQARVCPVRRPGGLHRDLRDPRPRGRPRSPHHVLRGGSADHSAVWRHHREVHWGRRHGGVGNAGPPGGRRREGRPRRSRPGRRRPGHPVRGGYALVLAGGAPSSGCGRHGRSRSHAGCRGPGYGGRGPGEHRLTGPVARSPRRCMSPTQPAGPRTHPSSTRRSAATR